MQCAAFAIVKERLSYGYLFSNKIESNSSIIMVDLSSIISPCLEIDSTKASKVQNIIVCE
jgi:hypothetical protein